MDSDVTFTSTKRLAINLIAKLLVSIIILVSCADPQNTSTDTALVEAANGLVWNQPKTTIIWNIIEPNLFLLNFEDAWSKCASLTETNHDWRLPSFSEANEAAAAKIVEAYRSESTWKPKLFWTSSPALSLESDNYKTIRLFDSASEAKPAEALAYTICVRSSSQEKLVTDKKIPDSKDNNDSSKIDNTASDPLQPINQTSQAETSNNSETDSDSDIKDTSTTTIDLFIS